MIPLLACALGCNRNVEPFDPDEEPAEPDLSRIFPEGAEQAVQAEPMLPEPPGRGAPPMAGAAAPAGGARGGSGAPAGAAADGGPITGTISLAPGLESRVPAGAVLFLIARNAAAGPPLAVKRIASPHFPLDFSIGPDDRMLPSIPFAGPVQLSARVDSDGNATSRTPGDLQGTAPGSVAPGATGVALVIDDVL